MALTNEILNGFFNTKPQQSPIATSNHNKNDSFVTKKPHFSKQRYKKYRIFDNPPELEFNSRQTQDKLETNTEQTQDKLETNLRQKTKTQNEGKTELKTIFKTNLGQTQDKLETITNFSSLVGLQRNIIIFLYENCKVSRDKITSPLSIEHIALSCKTTKSSAQKTIQRLEKKYVLKRNEFKNGRSGWTKYELPESVYQEILFNETQDKLKTNQRQNWDKVSTEPRTEPRTKASSSGGNNLLSTTTTSKPKNSQPILDGEWLNVDIEPLSIIGFTKTHLMQIASQNMLSTELVQGSIHAFAFDLQENEKKESINGDPINYFMGILRKGKPYTPPSNYESPQDRALRIYRERMRKIEQGRVEAEKEAMKLAFNEWFVSLTNEQKKELLPPNLRNGAKLEKSMMLDGSAWNKFKDEIWPNKKEEILQEISTIKTKEVMKTEEQK